MKKFFSLMIVLVTVFTMSISASAYNYNGNVMNDDIMLADGSTILMTDYFQQNGFVDCFYYNDGSDVLTFTSQPIVYSEYMGKISLKNDGYYVKYKYDNATGVWKYYFQEQVPVDSPVTIYANEQVKWSANDILDSYGDILVAGDPNFFPVPLAELVLGLTEEELVTVTIPEMVGAMKILVPCGVGLMALLAVLKLFGKRSLISRS